MMEQFCIKARKFGDRPQHVTTPLDRVYVFWNTSANNGKSRKQFDRYAKPLLNVSGLDIIVINMDSEDQVKELINYLPPRTKSIIVAGGSGTLMNVVTAVMKRSVNVVDLKKIPIGFIPLGYRNAISNKLYSEGYAHTAERIATAVLSLMEGRTHFVDLIEITTDHGKKVYCLNDIVWGSLVEATISANRYFLFGPLRGLFGYLRRSMKREICYPAQVSCSLASEVDTKEYPERFSGVAISVTGEEEEERHLELKLWGEYESNVEFVKQGLNQYSYRDKSEELFRNKNYISHIADTVRLVPGTVDSSMYFVDGEEYEAFPITVTLLPKRLQFFTDSSTSMT